MGDFYGIEMVKDRDTPQADDEARIAIPPDGVRELNSHGIDVLIQAGAGAGSSLDDDTFRRAGAEIVADAPELWERAELMCEVAGRMSVQVGAHFLERPHGGRGVLMGGAPGVRPARVVVLGAGNVGWNAAWMAAGLEAEVDLLDKNVDRLRHVDQIQMGRITTLASNRGQVERVITDADLVIGAVLVPGGRAPVVVTEGMVRSMKPGSVVVDIAIDQGGCVETSHETTHSEPTFERHGVLHYAVGNMPGAVPHTSTYALTNVTLPYVVELARLGVAEAVQRDAPLALGVNTARGHVVNTVVAEALGRPPADLESTLIEG